MSPNFSPQTNPDDEKPLDDSSLAAKKIVKSAQNILNKNKAKKDSRSDSASEGRMGKANSESGDHTSQNEELIKTDADFPESSHGKQTTGMEDQHGAKSASISTVEPPRNQRDTPEEFSESQSDTNTRRQRDQDRTERQPGNPTVDPTGDSTGHPTADPTGVPVGVPTGVSTVTTNQNHPNARHAEVQRFTKKWISWPIMALSLGIFLSFPLYFFHQHSLAVSDGDKQAIGGAMALQIVMWILAIIWQVLHTYFFGPAYGDAACVIQIIAALAVVGFMYYDFFVTGTGLPIVNSVLIFELLIQALWNAKENRRFTHNAGIARQDIELGRLEANEIRPTVAPQNRQP